MRSLTAAPDGPDTRPRASVKAASISALSLFAGFLASGFAGRSNLIEVGHLNWGKVLTLSGTPMKARCFIVGDPLIAQKLLAAGGAEVGLYLPTKLFVFQDASEAVHVSYDKFAPVMAPLGIEVLDKVAGVIDGVLKNLAIAAVS